MSMSSVAVSSGSYRQVQPTAISVTGFRIGLRICDTDIPPPHAMPPCSNS